MRQCLPRASALKRDSLREATVTRSSVVLRKSNNAAGWLLLQIYDSQNQIGTRCAALMSLWATSLAALYAFSRAQKWRGSAAFLALRALPKTRMKTNEKVRQKARRLVVRREHARVREIREQPRRAAETCGKRWKKLRLQTSGDRRKCRSIGA